MIEWLGILFTTVATATALIAIFEGMRRLSHFGKNRLAITYVVCGALWCTGGATLPLYISSITQSSAEILRKTQSTELPKDWGSNLSPEERERFSLSYASTTYATSGTLIQYFDLSGSQKTFSPSQSQLHEREDEVVFFERIDTLVDIAMDRAFRLGILALTAAAFGWWAGRTNRYNLANRSFEKDA